MSAPAEADVAKWAAAIKDIMVCYPELTEQEANDGLIFVLLSPEVQAEIRELSLQHVADVEQQAVQEGDAPTALWASVIGDLMERFPEWTEQETNDNLVRFLAYVVEHPDGF